MMIAYTGTRWLKGLPWYSCENKWSVVEHYFKPAEQLEELCLTAAAEEKGPGAAAEGVGEASNSSNGNSLSSLSSLSNLDNRKPRFYKFSIRHNSRDKMQLLLSKTGDPLAYRNQ